MADPWSRLARFFGVQPTTGAKASGFSVRRVMVRASPGDGLKRAGTGETIAPPGECEYCDLRRARNTASAQRRRNIRRKGE